MVRKIVFIMVVLALLGVGLVAWGYRTATADPVVRETRAGLAGWPAGAPPVRAVLLTDIHVAGPDMPPARLARIVEAVNRLRPDIVLIAGDFVSDKRTATRFYAIDESIAPLAGLRARFGTAAVLGNHDHWRDAAAMRSALSEAGVTVVDNGAVARGPLVIGGLDDAFTDHADLPATVAAMRRLPGARVMLSHSPDPFPKLPRDVGLMLAGHTHCGQIRLPLVGAISTMSAYGERYACGRIDENGRTLVVSAGLGTSILPLRIGAVPDFWLVTIGPRR
ncbi:metallophosphoesterase [Sphingosinicella sp. LHD-64]|uniref:metallophosphoesterase n=1 Tax=Sphingosinicella sp. LHD-64 TaxID=3072139 RepID=UPI00280D44F2|nr:metallophosphoesterase [Sphingosinicella sp. LHD-64]MDQ8756819.1 metallophosphoesterase [Sphingosinicella sp. LHD-64]